jgi:hypothetical protein
MTQENKDLNDSNELHDDAIQEIHENLIKDKELPKEGFSFLPIALIFLFAGVCFWGGIHIVTKGLRSLRHALCRRLLHLASIPTPANVIWQSPLVMIRR